MKDTRDFNEREEMFKARTIELAADFYLKINKEEIEKLTDAQQD